MVHDLPAAGVEERFITRASRGSTAERSGTVVLLGSGLSGLAGEEVGLVDFSFETSDFSKKSDVLKPLPDEGIDAVFPYWPMG